MPTACASSTEEPRAHIATRAARSSVVSSRESPGSGSGRVSCHSESRVSGDVAFALVSIRREHHAPHRYDCAFRRKSPSARTVTAQLNAQPRAIRESEHMLLCWRFPMDMPMSDARAALRRLGPAPHAAQARTGGEVDEPPSPQFAPPPRGMPHQPMHAALSCLADSLALVPCSMPHVT